MDAQTLTALQGSITKWEKIVAGEGLDAGTSNCPLCELFHGNFCQECPVFDKSQMEGCSGTPYEEWGRFFRRQYLNNGLTLPQTVTSQYPETLPLAQAELDFLKSLLPKDTDGDQPCV
jgi:hypothetical protein